MRLESETWEKKTEFISPSIRPLVKSLINTLRLPNFMQEELKIPHFYLNVAGDMLTKYYGDPNTSEAIPLGSLVHQQRSFHGMLALIDRDGVVVHKAKKGEYHRSSETVNFIWNAPEAIKTLNHYGILVVIITNQPGIYQYEHGMPERGLTIKDLYDMDLELQRQLVQFSPYDFYGDIEGPEILKQQCGVDWYAPYKAHIDAVFFCPHAAPSEQGGSVPDEDICHCRKPKPGMLEAAMALFGADPERTFMFGDFESDIQAAKNAGVRGVWVDTKHDEYPSVREIMSNKHPKEFEWQTFPDFLCAVQCTLQRTGYLPISSFSPEEQELILDASRRYREAYALD